MNDVRETLQLLEWKRRIFELYASVRASEPRAGWERWREERDALFAGHPQSPLPEPDRRGYSGIDLYDYDPAARVPGAVFDAPHQELEVPASRDETMALTRIGTVRFRLYETDQELDAFWVGGYGGGLFLPFRDATSGHETYGAGRYLYDTIKGADLGTTEAGDLILDFNFAYNPSCSYDPRWSCPLAPPANALAVPVRAGEKTPR